MVGDGAEREGGLGPRFGFCPISKPASSGLSLKFLPNHLHISVKLSYPPLL